MKHLGRIATMAFCLTFLVAGAASAADGCDGQKTGVQKASASGGCSSKGVVKQASSSGCAGKGAVQQASAGCASQASCQTMTCSKSGKALGTVQLISTDTGFRVVTVGCKVSGRNLLEQSATVLNSKQQLKGEIFEAKDGLYMDVNGDAAKNVYLKWQSWAKSGSANCLLTTENGDCLISADALGVRAG